MNVTLHKTMILSNLWGSIIVFARHRYTCSGLQGCHCRFLAGRTATEEATSQACYHSCRCLVLFYFKNPEKTYVLASLTSQRQKNVFTFSSGSCFSPISNLTVKSILYSLSSNCFKGLIYDVHCNIKVHSRIVFLEDCKTIFMFLWLIKHSNLL